MPAFEGNKQDAEPLLTERDPRFAALPPEERLLYLKLRGFRDKHNSESPFSSAELKEQDVIWDNCVFGLLAIGERPLLPYAANKGTFPADRFRLVPLFSKSARSYDPKTRYGTRGDSVPNPLGGPPVELDAPLGIALMYRHDAERSYMPTDGEIAAANIMEAEPPEPTKSAWETISVIGLSPDMGHRALLADQLQGGDTHGEATSDKAYKARLKFAEGSAEYALYLAAKDMAKEWGFEYFGLRHPETNDWPSVYIPAQSGRTTLYDRVMKRRSKEAEQSAFSEAGAEPPKGALKDYFLERFVPDAV